MDFDDHWLFVLVTIGNHHQFLDDRFDSSLPTRSVLDVGRVPAPDQDTRGQDEMLALACGYEDCNDAYYWLSWRFDMAALAGASFSLLRGAMARISTTMP